MQCRLCLSGLLFCLLFRLLFCLTFCLIISLPFLLPFCLAFHLIFCLPFLLPFCLPFHLLFCLPSHLIPRLLFRLIFAYSSALFSTHYLPTRLPSPYPMSRQRVARGLHNVNSAWAQITKTMSMQLSTPGLTSAQLQRYEKVTKEWSNGTVPHTSLRYYRFLQQVNYADPDYFVLCIIAFTQAQIDCTYQHVRDALIKRIQQNSGSAKDARNVIIAVMNTKKALKPVQKSNQGLSITTGQWVSFTHAELEGTKEIFGEDMVNKIKKPQMDRDWRAVTMRFPRFPASIYAPCFLILEIREEYVKELAMALLGIKVDWEPQVFPRDFSFQLRGGSEEAISAVFGPIIRDAITESIKRVSELAEEQARADCITMTFRWNGASIQLPMCLEKGTQIQRKLIIKNVS